MELCNEIRDLFSMSKLVVIVEQRARFRARSPSAVGLAVCPSGGCQILSRVLTSKQKVPLCLSLCSSAGSGSRMRTVIKGHVLGR